MAVKVSSRPWKAVARGVVVVYGISFVSGLVFVATGLTPQTDQVLYPLLALFSGAIGVAVGVRVMGTTGFAHLVALGLGLWLLNLIGVLVGAQTLARWLESSVFIAATVIGGRLLVGNSFASLPATERSPVVQNSGRRSPRQQSTDMSSI